MEDDELDITELLNKYEQMRAHGKKRIWMPMSSQC